MRIALIGPAFDIAGASLNLLRIADILVDAGHSVAVAAQERKHGALRQAYLDRGIPVVESIGDGLYDLAICNSVLTGNMVAPLARRMPVIWWIREALIGQQLVEQHAELAEGFRHATRIVMQSTYIRDHVLAGQLKGVPPERMLIVPQGIPIPQEFPRPERTTPHLVVTIGTLTGRKRPRDIFQAVASLRRSDVALVSIGMLQKVDPLVPELARRAPSRFRLLGELPREECFGWIAEADVLAHAASDESQPNVLIEAAFAGTPVATSNLPVLKECGWVDGENCLLHEVGDTPALARNIARLVDEPELSRRLVQNARETVTPRFAMDRFRTRLLEIVEEAAAA